MLFRWKCGALVEALAYLCEAIINAEARSVSCRRFINTIIEQRRVKQPHLQKAGNHFGELDYVS